MSNTSSHPEEEITAKMSASDLAQSPEEPLKPQPDIWVQVAFGARTDLGRARENNEDKFDFLIPEDPETLANNGALYAVADGMGGHAAGQIASELALKNFVKSYYSVKTHEIEKQVRTAVAKANSLVFDTSRAIPDRAGMGTTLVAAIIREAEAFILHVGDSRAYLIRNGVISRLTRDHSWVEEQVYRGALSEEEARLSPFKNVITRSIGVQPTVEADISQIPLADGDRILLCSDGLSGPLTDSEILEHALDGSPSEAALHLIDAANEKGGPDNITVFILSISGIGNSVSSDEGCGSEGDNSSAGWFARILGKH